MKKEYNKILLFILFQMSATLVWGQNEEKKSYYKIDHYNDSVAMDYLNNHLLDEIEGIWLATNGSKFCIEKFENPNQSSKVRYRVILLKEDKPGLIKSVYTAPGFIKAFLVSEAPKGGYSASVYRKDMFGFYAVSMIAVQEDNLLLFKEGEFVGWQLSKIYPIGESVSERFPKTESERKDSAWLFVQDSLRGALFYSEVGRVLSYEEVLEKYRSGRYKEALSDLEILLADQPDFFEALFLKAIVCYYKMKRNGEALEALNRAEEIVPDDPRVFFVRANLYLSEDRKLLAVKDLTRALSLNPQFTDAYYLRAVIKQELGDRNGAVNDLERGLVAFDTMPSAVITRSMIYNEKACCLLENGLLEQAFEVVESAIRSDKNSAYLYDTKGEICFHLGQWEECIRSTNEAIKLVPSGDSYYWRGRAFYEMKNIPVALSDFMRAGEYGKEDAFEWIRLLKGERK